MTSISNLKRLLYILFLAALCFPYLLFAQSSLSLSISPTLIELGAKPGDTWRSSVRIINSNSFELTVYGSVANFEPTGESGQGIFVPIDDTQAASTTLAEWVNLEDTEVVIPPQSTGELSFVVQVPRDAEPGGHFAALLVGTQPADATPGQVGLRTSQVVSSLFFLNVDGEIIEDGYIRGLSAINSFTQTPQSYFELRFENRGNVHLRPIGEIVIYNMWGRERGRIPINQNTNFGNALPGTIRKYSFSWEGNFSFYDIGLYRAEATVAYGNTEKRFSSQEVRFWVIPVKGLGATLLIIFSIVGFVIWAVRAYINRVFALAGINPSKVGREHGLSKYSSADFHTSNELVIRDMAAPIQQGVTDLRLQISTTHSIGQFSSQLWKFAMEYKKFFLGVLGLLVVIVLVGLFFLKVNNPATDYTVRIGDGEGQVSLNAEEIAYGRYSLSDSIASSTDTYQTSFVNVSGVAGTAGTAAAKVAAVGVPVSSLSSDIERKQARTIVIFSPSLQDEALRISDALGGVILSAEDTSREEIIILVGTDQVE